MPGLCKSHFCFPSCWVLPIRGMIERLQGWRSKRWNVPSCLISVGFMLISCFFESHTSPQQVSTPWKQQIFSIVTVKSSMPFFPNTYRTSLVPPASLSPHVTNACSSGFWELAPWSPSSRFFSFNYPNLFFLSISRCGSCYL